MIMSKQDSDTKSYCNMRGRTALCKHEGTCIRNVVLGFLGIFKSSLLVKFILQHLIGMSKILKIRTLLQFKKVFLTFEANKDTLRFALIAALINATYKTILCIFRRLMAK
jgi:hypothetical protein